jgi:hypothetical protein
VPAVIALPWLLDVFQHEGGNTPSSIPPLHAACRAMAATTALSLVSGAVLARIDPELDFGEAGRTAGRWVVGVLVAATVIGGTVLVFSNGGPGRIADRVDSELSAGTPDLGSQGSRFGLNLQSSRGDYWRIAWQDFLRHPLDGAGSGGFRHNYLIHRPNDGVQPEDPHSVEMLMLSELGLPGILLFGAFIGGALVAILRARRVGPSAAALAATVLATAAYWLLHASVDWFWSYPAITAPVAFGLGAAVAPACLRVEAPDLGRSWRFGLAGAAALVAVTMVPFFLSQTYADRGIRTGTSDPESAYADLRRAADLDPLTTLPALGEAFIAMEQGDRRRELSALDEAQSRTPEDWEPYYLEAKLLVETDKSEARAAIRRALELNPVGAGVIALSKRLGVS